MIHNKKDILLDDIVLTYKKIEYTPAILHFELNQLGSDTYSDSLRKEIADDFTKFSKYFECKTTNYLKKKFAFEIKLKSSIFESSEAIYIDFTDNAFCLIDHYLDALIFAHNIDFNREDFDIDLEVA